MTEPTIICPECSAINKLPDPYPCVKQALYQRKNKDFHFMKLFLV